MAKAFPRRKFAGFDISKQGVEAARRKSRQMGLTNATLEVKEDITSIGESKKYHFITAFDNIYTRSGAGPMQVLKEIHNALSDGGIFLTQDIAVSSNFFMKTLATRCDANAL
jgi:SAM-dependent methyltransferase